VATTAEKMTWGQAKFHEIANLGDMRGGLLMIGCFREKRNARGEGKAFRLLSVQESRKGRGVKEGYNLTRRALQDHGRGVRAGHGGRRVCSHIRKKGCFCGTNTGGAEGEEDRESATVTMQAWRVQL